MVTALFAGQVPTAAELNDLFTGIAGYGQRTSTSTTSSSTTSVPVLRIDNIIGRQGRGLLVGYSCHPDSATLSDQVRGEVRFSTSGAATTASSILTGSWSFAQVVGGTRHFFTLLIPPADATYSLLLTVARSTGASAVSYFCDTNRFTELFALNLGAATDVGVDI